MHNYIREIYNFQTALYPGLRNREYGHGIRRADHPQKLALASPKSSGRSVGIVYSQTKTME
jgi:hypothetical protein